MKITKELLDDIFNLKKKLTSKENKIKLSKYNDNLPLYNIYDDVIELISKKDIYNFILEYDYRFITEEIYKWLKNRKKKLSKKSEDYKKISTILKILKNYDLKTLEETSYNALYLYSPQLGMNFSICKKNSFNKYLSHIKPYYTFTELVKLGRNNKILDKYDPFDLTDRGIHYKVCKIISKNDIPENIITDHMKLIYENNIVSWIVFYSLYGSYIFNNFLRGTKTISENNYLGLQKIIDTINLASELNKDYYFYRLVWDDNYIKKLKVGDIYTEKGFLSCTRDPFYNPGVDINFGLILVKIYIPKGVKGFGLFIENYSMFPKEEEFIFRPNSKFKLLSRDDKFKYYHTNEEFENKIKTKYEFEYVGYDKYIPKLKKESIPNISLNILYGKTKVEMFKDFTTYFNKNKQIQINNVIFDYHFFNSIESYQHFYYNKTDVGLCLIHQDENGYPLIGIECGEELIINFMHKFFYYKKVKDFDINELLKIISIIGKILNYKKAKILSNYKNLVDLNITENINDDNFIFGTNKLMNEKFVNTVFDKETKVNHNLIKKYDEITTKTDKEILKLHIKGDALNMIYFDYITKYLSSNIYQKYLYYDFNINEYLKNNNQETIKTKNISYEEKEYITDEYEQIFSDRIRRIY
jgi:hypothetical protein